MTKADKRTDHAPTPLEEILVRLIEDHGPIRVSDYMADVLGHPQHGYYMTQTAFGADGDFTTAPEISQVFGELIGAWVINAWEEIGSPSFVNLIELGPGRGTLMADILRTAKIRPKFQKALSVYMIENSGRQRYEQQRKLQDTEVPITWATELHDIPFAPTIIVANEFFDCLPVRQYVRTAARDGACWRERLVGLTEETPPKLRFTLSDDLHEDPPHVPEFSQPDDIFETSEATRAIVGEIAERFESHKGRALIIDYGHARSGFGDTLQAIRDHHYWPPLASPGDADLTAHVDFQAIRKVAETGGLDATGAVEQGLFLKRLGIEERANALLENMKPEERQAFEAGVRRLVMPDQMGSIFKAVCLSSAGLPDPAGF